MLKDKPRILIMTKKDLCDMSVTRKWINYYENKGYHVIAVDLSQNNSVNEIIEFKKQIFKSRRRYYTHNYSLFDDRGVAGTSGVATSVSSTRNAEEKLSFQNGAPAPS